MGMGFQGENMNDAPVLFLGDCCVGTDAPHAINFERVIKLSSRLVEDRAIEIGFFLGDQVYGWCEPDQLRNQWSDFFTVPFRYLRKSLRTLNHIASNHVYYNLESAAVYEEFCGAAEWTMTVGGIQYLGINTAFTERNGEAGIDCQRLELRLSELDPTLPIVVLGHHPIWPVNGYDRAPLWVVPQAEGHRAWELMVKNGVILYACSHIIAFDVQLHHGMIQMCTGGAGTEYGPAGAMPGQVEGLHVVLVYGLGTKTLTIQQVSTRGGTDERWRLERTSCGWGPIYRSSLDYVSEGTLGYRLTFIRHSVQSKTISFFADEEGPPVCGAEADDKKLTVAITPAAGADPSLWWCATPPSWTTAEIYMIGGAGPGGVMASLDGGPLSSMFTASANGLKISRRLDAVMGDQTGVTMTYLCV